MLVGVGTWQNWVTADYDTLLQVFNAAWDHSPIGSYTFAYNQAVGPAGLATPLAPRVRTDDAGLMTGINAADQGYFYLSMPSCPGISFVTVCVRNSASNPPTAVGALQTSADGSQQYDTNISTNDWHELRGQGGNGGYVRLFMAGAPFIIGETGALLTTMLMCGSGSAYLPLVAGATTSAAAAIDNVINAPTSFIKNGILRAKGTFQQITDGTNIFVEGEEKDRVLFALDTPDGEVSLRYAYSPLGSSTIDAVLMINGIDFLVAEYKSPVGEVPTTTPGVGGNYLSAAQWAAGYDHTTGVAFIHVKWPGSMVTSFVSSGVSESLSDATAGYVHSSIAQDDGYPALVETITGGATGKYIWDAAPIVLLSDSLNDITGTTDFDVRPTNYVFTDDESEGGAAIEVVGAHGITLTQALDWINSFAASFPHAIAALEYWWVDLGWNVFPSQANSVTRTQMNALLDRLAQIKNVPIRLWIPSPAKSAVSGTAQARYEEFEADVLGGYYAQATGIDRLSRLTAPSMNAGAYSGTPYDLYAPYSADGQHYNLTGKQAKGALQREQAIADGVIP